MTGASAEPMAPNGGLRIGRIVGIPIYVHSSWIIIFALITLTLRTQFSAQHASWSPQQNWSLGVITSLLFFASVLFHELAHSVVAMRYKIPVVSITLFVFGGLARIGREAASCAPWPGASPKISPRPQESLPAAGKRWRTC